VASAAPVVVGLGLALGALRWERWVRVLAAGYSLACPQAWAAVALGVAPILEVAAPQATKAQAPAVLSSDC